MENKILELFEKQDTVSMNNDLFPILWDEFANAPLNPETYEQINVYIKQLLYGVYTAGVQVIAVPKFSGNPFLGQLVVEDVVYEKVKSNG